MKIEWMYDGWFWIGLLMIGFDVWLLRFRRHDWLTIVAPISLRIVGKLLMALSSVDVYDTKMSFAGGVTVFTNKLDLLGWLINFAGVLMVLWLLFRGGGGGGRKRRIELEKKDQGFDWSGMQVPARS